ncbi:MAG TPA: polymer-forming cytoskeletal protein [Methylocystis sp.]|nr:polymer-forming cytoskeletal protein [Methylocystis sp.]
MSAFKVGSGPVVYVGAGARIAGVLRGGARVEVHGEIDGEVACDQLIVGAQGRVEGAWSYVELEVEKGAVLRGEATPRARPDRVESRDRKGLAQNQRDGACPDRKTASHFSGTCSRGAAVQPRNPAPGARTTGVRRLVLVHVNREPSAVGKDASGAC